MSPLHTDVVWDGMMSYEALPLHVIHVLHINHLYVSCSVNHEKCPIQITMLMPELCHGLLCQASDIFYSTFTDIQ